VKRNAKRLQINENKDFRRKTICRRYAQPFKSYTDYTDYEKMGETLANNQKNRYH